MEKQSLTPREIAKYCDVHFRTVTRWISQGYLKAYQLPGRGNNRIPLNDFLAFLTEYEMPIPDELKPAGDRVLIADDDLAMAKSIQRCLKRQKFETAIALDGLRTGMMLVKFRPTVLTLDLQMPGMNGFDILDFVSQADYLAGLKILVISAMPKEELEQAKAHGADDILIKPFENSVLLEKVRKLSGMA